MIDELENEFFIIDDIDQEWMYRTICYGWKYDWDNNKDNYYLNTLVTDESEGTIEFEKIYAGVFSYDEFHETDQKYYSKPGRELIERVFEYEWI